MNAVVEAFNKQDISIVLGSIEKDPVVQYCKDILDSENGVVPYKPRIRGWIPIYISKWDGYVGVPDRNDEIARAAIENTRKERIFRRLKGRLHVKHVIRIWYALRTRHGCDNFRFMDALAEILADFRSFQLDWKAWNGDRESFIVVHYPQISFLTDTGQIDDLFEVAAHVHKVAL